MIRCGVDRLKGKEGHIEDVGGGGCGGWGLPVVGVVDALFAHHGNRDVAS